MVGDSHGPQGPEPFAFSEFVRHSFIRIVTTAQALEFIDALRGAAPMRVAPCRTEALADIPAALRSRFVRALRWLILSFSGTKAKPSLIRFPPNPRGYLTIVASRREQRIKPIH